LCARHVSSLYVVRCLLCGLSRFFRLLRRRRLLARFFADVLRQLRCLLGNRLLLLRQLGDRVLLRSARRRLLVGEPLHGVTQLALLPSELAGFGGLLLESLRRSLTRHFGRLRG